MKAEIILRLIERAREPLLKKAHLQEYARIQIEKDREDAALKASEFGVGYNQIKIEQAIKDRQITLD